MPMDVDRNNRMIVKRIIKEAASNENKRSDASCYGEIEIRAMTVLTCRGEIIRVIFGVDKINTYFRRRRRPSVFQL